MIKLLMILSLSIGSSVFAALTSTSGNVNSGPACINQNGCTGVGTPSESCIATGQGCYALNPNGVNTGSNDIVTVNLNPVTTIASSVCSNDMVDYGDGCVPQGKITKSRIAQINGKCVVTGTSIKLSKIECLRILNKDLPRRITAGAATQMLSGVPNAVLDSTTQIYNLQSTALPISGAISTSPLEQPL